ncbi:hypothetical protein Barb6_03242 [Bacteroidales bacterium Barb6]|nr:hypothetical protein Barb6_03242 [Bacteroidales bacterium Barb6]
MIFSFIPIPAPDRVSNSVGGSVRIRCEAVRKRGEVISKRDEVPVLIS